MRRAVYYCIGYLLVGLLLSANSHAQKAGQSEWENAKAFVRHVKEVYDKAGNLKFGIKYYYTNAGESGRSGDSLSGEVKMNKNKCRMLLASTETLVTDQHFIRVMDDEKLIYLAAAKNAEMINPVQAIDSLFAHTDRIRITVTRQAGSDLLIMDFPPGGMYTRISMEADARTGFFRKITYDLHTAHVVGQDMVESPGHEAPYKSEGRVEMVFSGYAAGSFADTVFDENDFIMHTASGYTPAGRFKDYHIFLANSNL